jgi:CheY-like chemotaxis protein
LAIHEKPLSIKTTLKNIHDQFERHKEKYVNFRIDFDSNIPDWILSDEKKLSFVVVQLMKNAVAFTRRGEVVLSCSTVTREQSNQCLVISVRDTGTGMSDKVQKSIFDAFSQADSSITRGHGGLGIGLTNVKDILNLMGGQLVVESEVGSGSTFTITMPITLATEAQIRETQRLPAKQSAVVSEEVSAQLKNTKILVVEDNSVNMTLMLNVLARSHYQTLSAVHGEEALAVLKENTDVAAILMDCQMPVMDGFEATRQIRQMARYEDLPIIAVTANIAEKDQQRCLDAGMSDYLAKPINVTMIRTTLDKWVSNT